MDNEIVKEVTAEFSRIDWFANVGLGTAPIGPNFLVVETKREAQRMQKSKELDFVTQEAQAWLGLRLTREFKEQKRDWNKVVTKARAFYEKTVEPKLAALEQRDPGWGTRLEDNVLWDVMAAFAERYYVLTCLPDPMWFSRELEIYRAGRIFCGYRYDGQIFDAFAGDQGTFLYY